VRKQSEKYENKKINGTECTASNVRFGATAAVTRLKVLYELESYYPAERAVKAAASQSRRVLSASGEAAVDNDVKNKIYNKILSQVIILKKNDYFCSVKK